MFLRKSHDWQRDYGRSDSTGSQTVTGTNIERGDS